MFTVFNDSTVSPACYYSLFLVRIRPSSSRSTMCFLLARNDELKAQGHHELHSVKIYCRYEMRCGFVLAREAPVLHPEMLTAIGVI